MEVGPLKMKSCTGCQQTKPKSDFYKDAVKKDGYKNKCKTCQAAREKAWSESHKASVSAYGREYYRKNKEVYILRARVRSLKKNYNLTLGDYAHMLQSQDFVCAACKTNNPGGKGTFVVDHCHTSGAVRGLLCNKCNLVLGTVKDSSAHLHHLAHYLEVSKHVI